MTSGVTDLQEIKASYERIDEENINLCYGSKYSLPLSHIDILKVKRGRKRKTVTGAVIGTLIGAVV